MRVLLADDHSIVRRGLRGLLEAAGLTVVAEASDGLEAARLCEEQRPDILILDIGMPKLSGIEVAARAQKLERPPGVIILSVHGDESYIMRALGAGARAYLLKSATDEDLIPAVRAVAAGKDDLAREALRRKRDNEENSAIYTEQRGVQSQAVAKLKDQLRQLEAKYQATLGARDTLVARQRRARAQRRYGALLLHPV